MDTSFPCPDRACLRLDGSCERREHCILCGGRPAHRRSLFLDRCPTGVVASPEVLPDRNRAGAYTVFRRDPHFHRYDYRRRRLSRLRPDRLGWSAFSTQYGKVFIIKLALVCMTLLLGGYNRLRLTAAVENGDAAASHRMRAIVGAEIMLVILVLSVTSLWRFTPPPRALALRPLITVSVHMHTPAAMATVSFEARSDQSFKVEVSVTTGDFDPLDPQELTLTMASTEGGVAPFKVPVQRRSVGFWTIDSIPLPKRADWNVKIDLLVSDFDVVRLEDHVNLPAE